MKKRSLWKARTLSLVLAALLAFPQGIAFAAGEEVPKEEFYLAGETFQEEEAFGEEAQEGEIAVSEDTQEEEASGAGDESIDSVSVYAEGEGQGEGEGGEEDSFWREVIKGFNYGGRTWEDYLKVGPDPVPAKSGSGNAIGAEISLEFNEGEGLQQDEAIIWDISLPEEEEDAVTLKKDVALSDEKDFTNILYFDEPAADGSEEGWHDFTLFAYVVKVGEDGVPNLEYEEGNEEPVNLVYIREMGVSVRPWATNFIMHHHEQEVFAPMGEAGNHYLGGIDPDSFCYDPSWLGGDVPYEGNEKETIIDEYFDHDSDEIADDVEEAISWKFYESTDGGASYNKEVDEDDAWIGDNDIAYFNRPGEYKLVWTMKLHHTDEEGAPILVDRPLFIHAAAVQGNDPSLPAPARMYVGSARIDDEDTGEEVQYGKENLWGNIVNADGLQGKTIYYLVSLYKDGEYFRSNSFEAGKWGSNRYLLKEYAEPGSYSFKAQTLEKRADGSFVSGGTSEEVSFEVGIGYEEGEVYLSDYQAPESYWYHDPENYYWDNYPDFLTDKSLGAGTPADAQLTFREDWGSNWVVFEGKNTLTGNATDYGIRVADNCAELRFESEKNATLSVCGKESAIAPFRDDEGNVQKDEQGKLRYPHVYIPEGYGLYAGANETDLEEIGEDEYAGQKYVLIKPREEDSFWREVIKGFNYGGRTWEDYLKVGPDPVPAKSGSGNVIGAEISLGLNEGEEIQGDEAILWKLVVPENDEGNVTLKKDVTLPSDKDFSNILYFDEPSTDGSEEGWHDLTLSAYVVKVGEDGVPNLEYADDREDPVNLVNVCEMGVLIRPWATNFIMHHNYDEWNCPMDNTGKYYLAGIDPDSFSIAPKWLTEDPDFGDDEEVEEAFDYGNWSIADYVDGLVSGKVYESLDGGKTYSSEVSADDVWIEDNFITHINRAGEYQLTWTMQLHKTDEETGKPLKKERKIYIHAVQVQSGNLPAPADLFVGNTLIEESDGTVEKIDKGSDANFWINVKNAYSVREDAKKGDIFYLLYLYKDGELFHTKSVQSWKAWGINRYILKRGIFDDPGEYVVQARTLKRLSDGSYVSGEISGEYAFSIGLAYADGEIDLSDYASPKTYWYYDGINRYWDNYPNFSTDKTIGAGTPADAQMTFGDDWEGNWVVFEGKNTLTGNATDYGIRVADNCEELSFDAEEKATLSVCGKKSAIAPIRDDEGNDRKDEKGNPVYPSLTLPDGFKLYAGDTWEELKEIDPAAYSGQKVIHITETSYEDVQNPIQQRDLEDPVTTPEVTKLFLDKTSLTIPSDGSESVVKVTATAQSDSAAFSASPKLTWTVDKDSIAKLAASAEGTGAKELKDAAACYIQGKTVGKAVVTVSYQKDKNTKAVTAKLTVNVKPAVTGISVSGTQYVSVEGNVSLKATVTPSNAMNKKVRWEVVSDKTDSNAESAYFPSADASKLIGSARGQVKVRAVATDGTGIASEPYTIHVVNPAKKATLPAFTMKTGDSLDIRGLVSLTPGDAHVEWKSLDVTKIGNVSALEKASNDGYTVKAVTAGKAKVTLKYTTDEAKKEGQTAEKTINATITVADAPEVKSFKVLSQVLSLSEDQPALISVQTNPVVPGAKISSFSSDNKGKPLSSSSKLSISAAEGQEGYFTVSVVKDAKITQKTTEYITVTSGEKAKKTFKLTIFPKVSDLKLKQGNKAVSSPISMDVNKSLTLKADITGGINAKNVSWTSSASDVAVVDEKSGKITAKGPGEAEIICTSTENKDYSAKVVVEVSVPVTKLVLSAAKTSAAADSTGQKAIGTLSILSFTPENTTQTEVSWEVSGVSGSKLKGNAAKDAFIFMDASGTQAKGTAGMKTEKIAPLFFTCSVPGTYTVKATAGKKSVTCKVTITQ